MKNVTHEADFCVIGGGMAGIAAALSSSRVMATLIRDFDIVLTDPAGHTETHAFRNVHERLFTCDLHGTCTSVRFVPLATRGADTFFVFSFEVL